MKFPLLKSSPLVGLDIQPHEARLVQLRKARKGFLVEQAVIVKLPEGIFADGKIRDWDRLRLELVDTIHSHKLSGMTAVINLPTNLVRIQQIQIPTGISDAAIEEEIRIKLERDFPGLGDSLCMDFSILNTKESGYSEVFSVVTRQEYVSQYIHCIHSIGLKTKIVEVDGYALKRIFNFASSSCQDEIYALACTIHHEVSLYIFAREEIIFQQMFVAYSLDEFLLQLKKRIQIFLSAFSDKFNQNLVVYCNNQQIKNIMDDWDFEIFFTNPFASIVFSPYINKEIDKDKLLVACGSAMREVPKW